MKFIGERFDMPYAERNFFGVVRVTKQRIQGSGEQVFAMSHGRTVHGIQFINPALRDSPTTYYVRNSGIGLALLHHPRKGKGLKVGLIGLGIGTVASYGLEGDEYRMYEINPDIIRLAEGEHEFFSFLSSSKARLTTIAGDARISLQHELNNGQNAGFDILILDAFSSDSIPVHLLTKEAFSLYLHHLAKDGVIAAHISNIHLDLTPVFWKLAETYGLQIAHVAATSQFDGGYRSDWLLLTKNSSFLNIPEIHGHSDRVVENSNYVDLWTDDFSNLLQIIK
jgi:spermidine synthase